MRKTIYHFAGDPVTCYMDARFGMLSKLCSKKSTVLLTDENVYDSHGRLFKGWNTLVIKPGEDYKVQATVDTIIEQLIHLGCDRQWMIVGVGGGVITDLTGYVASVFMRGVKFGFIPTTLLAMVDASIGGKNGIDVGVYKNMVGTINQPSFILFDPSLLSTLPQREFSNGCAEIIKHACITDRKLFGQLEKTDPGSLRNNSRLLSDIINRNIAIKSAIVKKDPYEKGLRKKLNFGHTLGHALENQYELSHGEAISIGMVYASRISNYLNGFEETDRVASLLQQYNLPTYASFDLDKVITVMSNDKKKSGGKISFVVLNKIGNAGIVPLTLTRIRSLITRINR